MKDCDIVNNSACGKDFEYCRTHKVEPKDCPVDTADIVGGLQTRTPSPVLYGLPVATLVPHPTPTSAPPPSILSQILKCKHDWVYAPDGMGNIYSQCMHCGACS